MKTLSSHSGKFPRTYWLHDVKCGEYVTSGSTGSVHTGEWRNKLVAVKFTLYYQENPERNAEIRKVN
jgi:hypothetical protein